MSAIVKISLDGGGQVVTSAITNEAAEDLDQAVGLRTTVLINSSDVTFTVD